MKNLALSFFSLAPLLFLMLSTPANAHKIRTFAYESGGEIITETHFGRGRPAVNTTITVMTSAGETVLTGTTDSKGIFTFIVPELIRDQQTDLTIIADAGEGHQGQWLLTADEYLTDETVRSLSTQDKPGPPKTPNDPQHDQPLENDRHLEHHFLEMEQRLEQTIVRELAPIKRQLAEQQTKKPGLGDIMSGLGYIFGLAGIIFYYQARKTRSQK